MALAAKCSVKEEDKFEFSSDRERNYSTVFAADVTGGDLKYLSVAFQEPRSVFICHI